MVLDHDKTVKLDGSTVSQQQQQRRVEVVFEGFVMEMRISIYNEKKLDGHTWNVMTWNGILVGFRLDP